MLKRYHYQRSPCVCGFLTSISKKLSGTLYISSICNCNVAVGVYCTGKKDKQVGKGGKEVLTVWPRPIILESSNALLRAKGDTVVIVVDVDVDDCGGWASIFRQIYSQKGRIWSWSLYLRMNFANVSDSDLRAHKSSLLNAFTIGLDSWSRALISRLRRLCETTMIIMSKSQSEWLIMARPRLSGNLDTLKFSPGASRFTCTSCRAP